jgi:hypothetical protein
MRIALVVLLLAGCHGGHPATSDAAEPDGGADAPTAPDALDAPAPPDSARGTMTVTVYGDGADRGQGMPAPGADVFFVAPDQSATEVTTGADGIATAIEPDNTTVWILHHDGTDAYRVETYEGVQIGDSIIGGDPDAPGPDTFIGGAYFAFPTYADATLYHLELSCDPSGTASSSSPIEGSVVMCPQLTAADAIVWATDSQGNLGYTSATGVDLTAHMSAASALALPAFQPGATIGVTFTNLPASMGESHADLDARYTAGTDPTILQQVQLHEDTLTDTMTASGAIAPFGDHTRVIGQVYIERSAYAYTYDGTEAQLDANVTIDASAIVHPSKGLVYDSATSSLTWTQQAVGVDPTVVFAISTWRTTSDSVEWYVTAPYSGSPSLALPTPPSALASLISSMPTPAGSMQLDLTSYAGKVYHDVLVGQTDGAPSWFIGVGP